MDMDMDMDIPETTFHRFPLLPTELRLKIWSEILPFPLLVPITFHRATSQYISPTDYDPLLYICHESRDFYLQSYTKLILNPNYESVVYVNFAIDTLYFNTLECSPDGDFALDLALSPHRDRIRKLAIESQLWEVLRVFRCDSLSEIGVLPGLKTLMLVLDRKNMERNTMDVDGTQRVLADEDGQTTTVGNALEHVHWHAQSLRLDMRVAGGERWGGMAPNVQILVFES